jgi:hypothetical protein
MVAILQFQKEQALPALFFCKQNLHKLLNLPYPTVALTIVLAAEMTRSTRKF